MENAMQFFDELKEKYMHQVEQAIEDWDYQDFSPDKRCALLDGEIASTVEDDNRPEPNAHDAIKDASRRVDWHGLSADDELADYDYGQEADSSLSYEAKLVALCTPAGGIQGMPDTDSLQRFLNQASRLDITKVTAAFGLRLQSPTATGCWQVRAKVMVLMQLLIESKPLAARFLPAFRADGHFLSLLDQRRTGDHNQVVREHARKLLSLIGSNGVDPLLIPRQASPTKLHIRHHAMKTKRDPAESPTKKSSTGRTAKSPAKSSGKSPAKPVMKINTAIATEQQVPTGYQHSSPKVARAALASWRRRSMASRVEQSSTLMPFQQPAWTGQKTHPPAAPAIVASSAAPRYLSGQKSAFAFIR